MQWFQNLVGNGNKQQPKVESAQQKSPGSIGSSSGGAARADGRVTFGWSVMRGKRASMEDFSHAEFKNDAQGNQIGLFGVFDGHGGPNAARFVQNTLFESLMSNSKFSTNVEEALTDSFKATDDKYLEYNKGTNKDDGCTAVTAILVGQTLYIANVGDSRAVLSRKGEACALTVDHKPNDQEERKRIEGAGGVVVWAGTWRVGGVLAVSRAFGDRLLKKYVTSEPDVQKVDLKTEDEIAILASDGLWDVIKNQDAIGLVKDEKDAEKAAKLLTEEAYTRGSNDNISCIVIRFRF